MIDTNVLKIGDIVLYKGKHITIGEVGYGLCSGIGDDGIFYGKIPYEFIEPVPLTEEIFLKNGWEKVRINPFHSSIFDYKLVHEEKPTFYMRSGKFHHDFYRKTRLSYVHKLQHILWALDIDSNLKI